MAGDGETAGYHDPLTGDPASTGARAGAAQVGAVRSPELRSLVAPATAAVVIAGLYFGRDVLIPITLAVMLSFVLSPIVNALQRLRLWRAPAVILTVLFALGVIGSLGLLIGTQAASLSVEAPRYARTIATKMEGAQAFAADRLASVSKTLGLNKPPARRANAPPSSLTAPQPARGPARRPVLVEVAQAQATPLTIARTLIEPIMGPLETTVIVLIVAIFVLMQKEDLRDRFIRLFGSSDLHRTTAAMDDAGRRLSRYFLSQLAVNASFGLVIGLGLWALGIPSPAMWGILAGLLRFVPYIGSVLAAVAPLALAAAVDPGWTAALEVAALFVLVEPLTGYVVEPLLYGHSTGLSPVSVIVSAIFWAWLWGPIGLIMSTPLTLCLVVLGRHVKSLEFFDVLLGDRPALTPIERFYQRILADNPDEALAQAELILTRRALGDYYDDVVLQGLKLAAEDEARGTIDRARAAEMTASMVSLIHDLSDHAEPAPGSPRADGPARIACIAGGGPFDETVSAMLVQLLGQRQVAARAIPAAAAGRDTAATLDLAGIEVIAVSYLELRGSPAQLRYLTRRLRARAPGARLVVGLWPEGEGAMSDLAVQQALGADRYVGTLSAAADAIVELLDQPAERAVA